MHDIPIDIGPTRHGITRGCTIYFFDPSGNRNEISEGGDTWYPDHKTITWTVEQVGKGIFYHDRKLNERFMSVVTRSVTSHHEHPTAAGSTAHD